MFEDLINDNPEAELRLPSARSTAEYGCIRCGLAKLAGNFVVAAYPSKSGVCRRCATSEERLAALTLPMWRGISATSKTKAERMFERNTKPIEIPPQKPFEYVVPQHLCDRCHQEAKGGRVTSLIEEALLVCHECYDKEVQAAFRKL